MAVGFLSGLHSQKCRDHAENLSSALVKLNVQDVNVQRRACPALISANANVANDYFVMYITTVSSFRLLKWNRYSVSLYCTTEKLYDTSVSCIPTKKYRSYYLIQYTTDTHKMCSLVTTHIYVMCIYTIMSIIRKTIQIISCQKSSRSLYSVLIAQEPF